MNKYIITFLSLTLGAFSALAEEADAPLTDEEIAAADSIAARERIDAVWAQLDSVPQPVVRRPTSRFTPVVYLPYEFINGDTLSVTDPAIDPASPMAWIDREKRMFDAYRAAMQRLAVRHPEQVTYIQSLLPEAPKKYVVELDPTTAMITIVEQPPVSTPQAVQVATMEVRPQHWLNKFGVNLQFSQAYVSPNWYQGGNSSLNMVFDFQYNTKLNQKFHPNLLFENNFQWRTALASSPDDEFRAYNFTENRFQINSTFGLKAFNNHWYYTITGMLKTPIFNAYKSNTEDRTAAFMAPGEMNIGVGMTYTLNKSKFNLKLSLSPLAYNLKTMLNEEVRSRHPLPDDPDHTRKTMSSYGSSGELTWNWQMATNVKWNARMFLFTDYDRTYMDWQNQLQFTINRFMTANVNVDMRWDTSMLQQPDSRWHKFQLRELLTLGFTYSISH